MALNHFLTKAAAAAVIAAHVNIQFQSAHYRTLFIEVVYIRSKAATEEYAARKASSLHSNKPPLVLVQTCVRCGPKVSIASSKFRLRPLSLLANRRLSVGTTRLMNSSPPIILQVNGSSSKTAKGGVNATTSINRGVRLPTLTGE
jgi:hypothetical protein